MPVTLVRHTRPEVASDVCYGSTDLQLAESFVTESRAVISALSACDVLVSSPLQRCRILADAISEAFGAAVTVDARLREMDFGRWEGKRWSEIPRNEVAMWSEDFLHARPHGGESVAMLRTRTQAALADYRSDSQHCILVTHSGVIKAALSTGDTATDFDAKIDFGGVINFST